MPTRSGLDFHTVHPSYFVCAYCYEAHPDTPVTKFKGMILKRVQYRIDERVNAFATIPDEWTRVWTEPHCMACTRRVRGYAGPPKGRQRYTYSL